ncbi:LysR family transcriptional regulator [Saccharomonospora piscinae]|uniref:LysR family transcriptional regulator n=1 Tax=Saccharomonospora piscinae TaxID=687388 RepID=A0A1V9A1Z8_SACPI|nr:LysR family transcriptional regulator [Saccharomonospora piscinae]OQO91165.1 LysR family transcriptional regulator [Saccharomonospora piscinae]
MTLGQLSAFVLVARLGSVTEAARVLGISEPAVSQALAALRHHHGDRLLVRTAQGMTLTPAGRRLLPIASHMVALGADADAAVRRTREAPEPLRVAVTSTLAEFVAGPLLAAFGTRGGDTVDVSSGLATTTQMPVLVHHRLADAALGPALADAELDSVPVFRCALVVVGPPGRPASGHPPAWPWLVGPSGADPGSDTATLLRRLHVPDGRVQVFPTEAAAWSAAASGGGVSVAVEHLVAPLLRRQELTVLATPATPAPLCWHVTTPARQRCSAAAASLRSFLGTPAAMQLMRSPGSGVPPSRFRPPVHVTIWS